MCLSFSYLSNKSSIMPTHLSSWDPESIIMFYTGQLGWEQLCSSCSSTLTPHSLLTLCSGTFCKLHSCIAIGTSLPALLVTSHLPINTPCRSIQYTDTLIHLQHPLLFSAAFSKEKCHPGRKCCCSVGQSIKRMWAKAVQRKCSKGGIPKQKWCWKRWDRITVS